MNGRTLRSRQVVTAFLRQQGKILLLKRSEQVRSYRGLWGAVSGSLEEPTALAQAWREIREETGLADTDMRLVTAGSCLEIIDTELATRWLIHPFLFEVATPQKLRLNWEHEECRWVEPTELVCYRTVPALAQSFEACLQNEAVRPAD